MNGFRMEKKVALFISAGSSAYHVYVEMYVLTEDPTTCTNILNLSSNMPPPPLANPRIFLEVSMTNNVK